MVFIGEFHQIQEEYKQHQFIYTDGSKINEQVGSATAELNAIMLALKFVPQSRHDRFRICSDSLSSLQGIESMKLDNPFKS